MVEILQLVHEISCFPEVFYKRSVLKNFSKFTDKHKEQSSGGVLSEEKMLLKNFAKFTEKRLCRSLFSDKVASWKPETVRSSHWRCSVKQGLLKNFANFTGKNLCWRLFLIKLQFWGSTTLLKKTPTQVLSCEICKLLKNNYFEEHLWTPASKIYLKKDSNIDVFLWILWII